MRRNLTAAVGIALSSIAALLAILIVLAVVGLHVSLDDPMLGTGIIGVLNGWATLAFCGLLLAAGVFLIVVARRG